MNAKEKFLYDEFWMLSWNGSVQHASVYLSGIANLPTKDKKKFENCKNEFRKCLIKYCEDELLPMYEMQKVIEAVHCKNIEKLKKFANSCSYKKILHEGNYRIGIAQKLLNLRLKYLWCEGKVEKPPHCPIDSTILKRVGLGHWSWTKMDSMYCYKKAMQAIAKKAHDDGYHNIADWELYTFNKLR